MLAGLLVMIPRVSPLAAGLPGLLLLAWTALYLVSVRRAVAFIPLRSHAFGAGWKGCSSTGSSGQRELYWSSRCSYRPAGARRAWRR